MRPQSLRWYFLAGFLVAVACSDGTSGPSSNDRLLIVAAPSPTDTIDATPVQGLVVELRDEQGKPAIGIVVRFTGLPLALPFYVPSMLVGSVTDAGFVAILGEPTDERGRATARVRFGGAAGPAGIEVAVPELGLADTVAFTVIPGAAASVRLGPQDTTLYPNAVLQIKGQVLDRHDNPRPDAVAYNITSTPLGIASVSTTGQLNVTAIGRVAVIGTAGTARDTAFVSVVPQGRFVAVEGGFPASLVAIELDGSGRRVLRSGPLSGDLEPACSPSCQEVAVAPSGTVRQIDLVAQDGTFSSISSGLGDPYWPAYSPDGQFIYFSGIAGGLTGIWRAKRDGTLVEPITTGVHFRPSISPDGRFVTFHALCNCAGDVAVRVFDLQAMTTLPVEVPGRFPEWSPVGDDIAFIDSDTRRLRVMRSDGSGGRYLTPPGRLYVDNQLSWSPDGRWVLAREQSSLELIEVQTGLLLPLGFATTMVQPTWK